MHEIKAVLNGTNDEVGQASAAREILNLAVQMSDAGVEKEDPESQ